MFLGSRLTAAGPMLLLAYVATSVVAYLLMRAIGEMVLDILPRAWVCGRCICGRFHRPLPGKQAPATIEATKSGPGPYDRVDRRCRVTA